MKPVTGGDIIARYNVSKTTLKYWRRKMEFPEPRWTIGGARKINCWTLGEVEAWWRDRHPHGRFRDTRYRAGLALYRQLGGINAAADHAGVSDKTFRNFLRAVEEYPPQEGALRVLELAAERADPETAQVFRSAARRLTTL